MRRDAGHFLGTGSLSQLGDARLAQLRPHFLLRGGRPRERASSVQGPGARTGRTGTHVQIRTGLKPEHGCFYYFGLRRKVPGAEAGCGGPLGAGWDKASALGREAAVWQLAGGVSRRGEALRHAPAVGASLPGRGCGARGACLPPPSCYSPHKGRERNPTQASGDRQRDICLVPRSCLHILAKAPTRCKERLGTRGR